jgi:hypothetical protein
VAPFGPGSSSGGGFRGGLYKGATKACGALIRATWFPRKTVSPSFSGPFSVSRLRVSGTEPSGGVSWNSSSWCVMDSELLVVTRSESIWFSVVCSLPGCSDAEFSTMGWDRLMSSFSAACLTRPRAGVLSDVLNLETFLSEKSLFCL